MTQAATPGGRVLILAASLPLFIFAPHRLRAQQAKPGSATISVDVNLVVLRASVRDGKGRFVSGLEKQNFHVFEDGVPQQIRVFQHEDVPVAVGLIVDNSGSMGPKKSAVIAAALAFAHSSNPHDQMFVVNFNEHVSFNLPNGEPFSSDPGDLEDALTDVHATGRTALYDALEAGLGHLAKATCDRKVLIVISDGGDNASHHKRRQVLDATARSDAMIYTIGLFNEYDEDRNPRFLDRIASVTGGAMYLPTRTKDVVPICRRIAADIRHQYTIGYVPSNRKFDNTFRDIRLTATGPHGHELKVRTRHGYIASLWSIPAAIFATEVTAAV